MKSDNKLIGIVLGISFLVAGCDHKESRPANTDDEGQPASEESFRNSRPGPSDAVEFASPSEIPGGLEILDLTKDQAAKINAWEQELQSAPRPDQYAKFIESILRHDQLAKFRMIVGGDKEGLAQLTVSKLELAADTYKADCGQFPSKAEDLSKDPGNPEWQGPYFRGILDPWGIPFQLEVVDGHLKIRSWGPDRNPKTEDDITN